jgi:hypothetical protein
MWMIDLDMLEIFVILQLKTQQGSLRGHPVVCAQQKLKNLLNNNKR